MKVFHCDHCDHLVFFESVRCVKCERPLAYLPDQGVTGSLDAGEGGVWHSPLARAKGQSYKLCQNYTDHNICNWAVAADDSDPFCVSCRFTRVIPNLSTPGNKEAWFKLEVAKRRLFYSLLSLKLPLIGKAESETGLAFEFLDDADSKDGQPVLTGHDDGLITMNIAEADDAERERRRHQMHELYRTLLGHFRHEIGHYYWDQLIKDGPHLERYRELFGDEREDYAQALERHYQNGTPPNWQDRFISAYATTHPWEDWAETWTHYLHMIDTLETASDCGLSMNPKRVNEPELKLGSELPESENSGFPAMIERWHALTYVLNNLNRGMGLADGYPFVISAPVIEKLRFVHEIVAMRAM